MSPVNVGQLISEVTAESEATVSPQRPEETSPWRERDRVRAEIGALATDAMRTRAEGMDA